MSTPTRAVALILGLAVATPSAAQNTVETWRVGTSTTCGVRQIGSTIERFIAEDTSDGLAYDFAPSDEKWRRSLCSRDRNAPPPALEDILAQVRKPRPTCAEFEARWAAMPPAQRREIEAIRSRPGYRDVCTTP